jgi:hypothetical protein
VVESGTTPGFSFTGELQDSSGMAYLLDISIVRRTTPPALAGMIGNR